MARRETDEVFEQFANAHQEAVLREHSRERLVSAQLEAAIEGGLGDVLDLAGRVSLRPDEVVRGWIDSMADDAKELYAAGFSLNARSIREQLPGSIEAMRAAHDIGTRLCTLAATCMDGPQPVLAIESATVPCTTSVAADTVSLFRATVGLTRRMDPLEVVNKYRYVFEEQAAGVAITPTKVSLHLEKAVTITPIVDWSKNGRQVTRLWPHESTTHSRAKPWILKSDAKGDPENPVIRTDEKAKFAYDFEELVALRKGEFPELNHFYVGDFVVAAALDALKSVPGYRHDFAACYAIADEAERMLHRPVPEP